MDTGVFETDDLGIKEDLRCAETFGADLSEEELAESKLDTVTAYIGGTCLDLITIW